MDDIITKNINLFTGYPEKLITIKEEFHDFIEKKFTTSARTIITTGHQVELFHPGIIAKELYAAKLAKETGGIALSLVLDHDPVELFFQFPVITEKPEQEPEIRKQYFPIGVQFYSGDQENQFQIKSGEFIKTLSLTADSLKPFYTPDDFQLLQRQITNAETLLPETNNFTDLIVSMRRQDLIQVGANLHFLKISEVVQSKPWQEFTRLLLEKQQIFSEVFNKALHDYRKIHHIKNHAQPIPDLTPKELPFWIENHERIANPEFSGSTPRKLRSRYRRKLFTDQYTGQVLLPRAVTLSLFFRWIGSDLFIHGTGGGRYDQITNQIGTHFFQAPPPEFKIITNTLSLPIDHLEKYKKIKYSQNIQQWNKKKREFWFNPEKQLPPDQPLRVEIEQTITELTVSSGSRKNIHENLEKLRSQARQLLQSRFQLMEGQKEKITRQSVARKVLNDRTFPYFFYGVNSLREPSPEE